MKRILILIFPLIFVACGTLNTEKLLSAGVNLATSYTITDEQVAAMCTEYIVYQDQQSTIAAADSPYTVRLNNLVSKIKGAESLNLNFKVYHTDEINAFACGDGSIRIYSGLMDVMTDEEVFAVIGHEIGHLKNSDTKNMMIQAYKTAAIKDAIGAINTKLEKLTSSQLAAIATAYSEAQFSQTQEFAADNMAFNICLESGFGPYAMYNALTKLVELAGGADSNQGIAAKVAQMFSTHPDSATRAAKMKQTADNYVANNR